MSVFLEEIGFTDEDRLKLFSLYAMHLKDLGKVPRDYFQALQGDFAAMFKPTGFVCGPKDPPSQVVRFPVVGQGAEHQGRGEQEVAGDVQHDRGHVPPQLGDGVPITGDSGREGHGHGLRGRGSHVRVGAADLGDLQDRPEFGVPEGGVAVGREPRPSCGESGGLHVWGPSGQGGG